MAIINNVIEMSGFARDVSFSYTANGHARLTFMLEIPEDNKSRYPFKIRTVAWRDVAEQYTDLPEGANVTVMGVLRNRSYDRTVSTPKGDVTIKQWVTEFNANLITVEA